MPIGRAVTDSQRSAHCLSAQQGSLCGNDELFFTVGNAIKAVPWLLLVKPTGDVWTLMAVCLLAIPAGVWLGWRLHGRLDQLHIYRACYGLPVVTALKLLWDGVSGYLA